MMARDSMGQRMDRLILSPAERRAWILQFLAAARRTNYISIFRCDDLRIVDELASAVMRGVEVRILLTLKARVWSQKLKDWCTLRQSFGGDVESYESRSTMYMGS